MFKILVVTISAPPKTGPESLQAYKYLKFLKEYFKLTLVTTTALNYGWKKHDSSLELEIDRILVRVVRYRLVNSILSRVFKKKNLFDEGNIFLSAEKFVINKLKNNYDLIYSRSTPFESAKLAFKLKEKLKIPWVMHLSDPWADNTFFRHSIEESNWERRCFKLADGITFTSQNTIDYYTNKYPAYSSKFHLSHNSFDHNDLIINESKKSKKLTLVYAGNQYKDRNVLPVIEAIKQLSEEDQAFIEFNIYGYIDHAILTEIKLLNCASVKIFKSLPYKEVLIELSRANILISVDKPAIKEIDLVYLPSKISDYILLKRKILNLSSSGSATSKLINGKLGLSFEHHETNKIQNYLQESLKKWKADDHLFFKINCSMEEFDILSNGQYLKDLMIKLINKSHEDNN